MNRPESALNPARPELTAVLLIAHGSRRQAANDDLLSLAELVRARRRHDHVEVAYLELAEPTIPQAARSAVAAGAGRVLMLPYFLAAGEHVAGDLERYRRESSREFSHVEFVLCPPLGLHPLLVEVVLQRLDQGGTSRQSED